MLIISRKRFKCWIGNEANLCNEDVKHFQTLQKCCRYFGSVSSRGDSQAHSRCFERESDLFCFRVQIWLLVLRNTVAVLDHKTKSQRLVFFPGFALTGQWKLPVEGPESVIEVKDNERRKDGSGSQETLQNTLDVSVTATWIHGGECFWKLLE